MNQEKIADLHIVIGPNAGEVAAESLTWIKRGWELSGDIQLACDSNGEIKSIAQRLIYPKQQN